MGDADIGVLADIYQQHYDEPLPEQARARLGQHFHHTPCEIICLIKTGMSGDELVDQLARKAKSARENEPALTDLADGCDNQASCIDPCSFREW